MSANKSGSPLVRLARMAVEAERKSPRRDRVPPPPRVVTAPTNSAASVAAQVIRAGQARRGEITDAPKLSGVAAQIIAAGKRRRGET